MNEDLLAFLQSEEARSYDGSLLEEVEVALKSYNCEEYGDEEEGRSRVVAADVSETVDYMLTSIMDVFAGTGRVVEFEPTDESEEDACDDATEAMHYIYRKKAGYRFIHDWAKAGLLEKIAISKSCVERKRERVERVVPAIMLPGETEEELRAAGIIEAEETGEIDETGVPLIRIVTIEHGPTQFPDYFVPLEEFRRAPDARDLDSAVYLAHICEKSLSDLVQMGFDPELLEGLEGDNPHRFAMGQARDDGRSEMPSDRTGALRKVWLCEEYVLFDLNGDGIAERLCIHRVGNTILEIEEVDYQPFEFWCPFPMQGRLVGQSFADKTIDTQRKNTVLERNMLDSLYFSTAPGTYVHEDSVGDHTIDDLLTVRPGRIVRFKGAMAPIPEQRNDISGTAMQAIEFFVRQRESRTGITRLNKGIDEDTLNDTASGQDKLMARGQQMERYVIRNFAEGVARLFMKKRHMMNRHGSPFNIKVDGKWRTVDPSMWGDELDINVKVGLGSGSKDERLAHRTIIAGVQEKLKVAGSPLVSDENLYNNIAGYCKDAGLQPNDLFTAPPPPPVDENGDPIPPEPPQDPEMVKAQAELQLQQVKLQGEQQMAAAKLEMQQNEAALKLQLAREEAEAEAELARAKAAFEAQLAREKMELERQLAFMQAEVDREIASRNEQRRDRESEAKVKQNRKGGSLAE